MSAAQPEDPEDGGSSDDEEKVPGGAWPRQPPPPGPPLLPLAHDEEEQEGDDSALHPSLPRSFLGCEVRIVDDRRVYTTLGAPRLLKLWPRREWQSRGAENAEPGWGASFAARAGTEGVVVHEWDGARPQDPTSAPWPGAQSAAKGRQHPVLVRVPARGGDCFVPIDSGGVRVLRRTMAVPAAEQVVERSAEGSAAEGGGAVEGGGAAAAAPPPGAAVACAAPVVAAAGGCGGGDSSSSSSSDDEDALSLIT